MKHIKKFNESMNEDDAPLSPRFTKTSLYKKTK